MRHVLYQVLYAVSLVLYLPKALWRRRLPHRGWRMRLGRYGPGVRRQLGERQTLWLHAVSVGEMLAARPLAHALAQAHPLDALVLSTVTPGGFSVAAKTQVVGAIPIYVPLDLTVCVRRALDTLKPRMLFLMESELWPTLIRLTKAREIPIAVVNGRISDRAFRRYGLVKRAVQRMLRDVDLFLMQSQEDADRLLALGAPKGAVRVVGNLKWESSFETCPTEDVLRLAAARLGLGNGAPVIVGGSTHRGEEQMLLEAFEALRGAHRSLRLILAPRHLERLGEVEALIRQRGLTTTRLSQSPLPGDWTVGLVDTFGQLPVYYGLATVAFVGGSLIPHGGQNPLEPASVGKPVLFGPSMHNFARITHQLLAHRAARQLSSRNELNTALAELLADAQTARTMGRRAQELVESFRGTTQRILQALAPLLQRSNATRSSG